MAVSSKHSALLSLCVRAGRSLQTCFHSSSPQATHQPHTDRQPPCLQTPAPGREHQAHMLSQPYLCPSPSWHAQNTTLLTPCVRATHSRSLTAHPTSPRHIFTCNQPPEGREHGPSSSSETAHLTDMRHPSTWFPGARAMHRKIIAHLGPTNSGMCETAGLCDRKTHILVHVLSTCIFKVCVVFLVCACHLCFLQDLIYACICACVCVCCSLIKLCLVHPHLTCHQH